MLPQIMLLFTTLQSIQLSGELVGIQSIGKDVITRMGFITCNSFLIYFLNCLKLRITLNFILLALKYVGCYPDNAAIVRDLNGLKLHISENIGGKVETCIALCRENRFIFAGLQSG